MAHQAGFLVRFIYVCVESLEISIQRIRQRAWLGGHSGSEKTIAEIRKASLANFRTALNMRGREIDFLDVYDNSVYKQRPRHLFSFVGKTAIHVASELPQWMVQSLDLLP